MEIRSIGNPAQSGQLISERTPATEHLAAAKQAAAPTLTLTSVQKPDAVADNEKITNAVKNINKTIQALSQNLEFSLDKEDSRVIVKIVDQQTKEVLRQIPTEETLEIARSLDKLKGLLIHQQA